MNIQQFIKLSSAIVILFAACTPGVQRGGDNNASRTDSKIWKKEVARMIDMGEKEDTIVHHLRDANQDSSFIVMVINAIKAGQLAAYSNVDHSFTTKFTAADLNNLIAPRIDTVIVTDPVTNDEIPKVIRRDFDMDVIHKYRILENWAFDPATGKTGIIIEGIAPIREIYGDDGVFRGVQAIFWLKYDDVRGILAKCEQYHPNHNLNTLIWDDYFLSDAKPSEVK
jgi:hypothetical protein